MSTEQEIRRQLDEIDALLAANPERRDAALDRIYAVMGVAGAANNEARSSFILGQIFEALLPLRERASLLARRARLVKQLNEAIPSPPA